VYDSLVSVWLLISQNMAASHLDGQKATRYAAEPYFGALYLLCCRKHKLTDKNIPNAIFKNPEFLQDSQMYQSLLEMERKLDWTMTRKKVEVQDALSRTPTVRLGALLRFCVES